MSDQAEELPAPSLDGVRNLVLVVCAAAAAVIVGSTMPWLKISGPFGGITGSGMEGDGKLTLVGGLTVAFFAVGAFVGRAGHVAGVALACAVVTALIAVYEVVDVANQVGDFDRASAGLDVDASVGVGLWVVLAGATVAVAACTLMVLGLRKVAT